MHTDISPQKILRTGDLIVTKDKKTCKVHYLVEHDGQLSFESLMCNVKNVIAVREDLAETINAGDFRLLKE